MRCKFCSKPATHVGAQSGDQGKTFDLLPICREEIPTWNVGGDWIAPVYELGREILPPTDSVLYDPADNGNQGS